ncbi:hypothetical protein J3B02_000733 [Coemansia erecta]|uniref:Uncharacterized protein n=1 Tax=Coemansia asiatica TaxID=1052880 RepID=A0A9W7XR74_9FUNG|nr:hypothetical protein LPJ64_000259 [Coemansia asiatica]KAJ2857831.1 hypothetical protein J3B02_000733 [Coemansia erecta]KAJ2887573.1 hypothetical protein FB639_001209 [Coemansia asiatica]
MAKLDDLPHELLHKLLILSSNEQLVIVNRWTYTCLRRTTTRTCYKFVRQKGRWEKVQVVASALQYKFLSVDLLDQIDKNKDELDDGAKKLKKKRKLKMKELKIPSRLFQCEETQDMPVGGRKRRRLLKSCGNNSSGIGENQKRYEIVKKLLCMKISVKEGRGNAGLMLAAKAGNLEMVKLLLKKGADAVVGGENKALLMAVVYGHLPVVKRLVKAGAPVSSIALRYAVQKKHCPVIDWLMKNGAAPDMVTIKLLDKL